MTVQSAAEILKERNERVSKIMLSEEYTEGEKRLVQYQFQMASGFWSLFWPAAFKADFFDRLNLAKGFPDEIKALQAWERGELQFRLRQNGLAAWL